MSIQSFREAADRLSALLKLPAPPLAISFSDDPPQGAAPYDAPMPEPTADGRTGRVPAGCVFWIESAEHTFTTVGEDHGNCSVGSVTHGFKTLEDVAGNADVKALLDSGWVTMDMVPQIPTVSRRFAYVTYGPLSETPCEPDVVFMRLNGKQLMVLHDALPDLRFEGKPQCHIIPIAREQGEVAVSVGCMLSRVRTGMPNTEVTCAIPAAKLSEVIERLEGTCAADHAVAAYASEDAARFGS